MGDRDISGKDTSGQDYTQFNEDQPKLPEYNINITPNFHQDNIVIRLDQIVQALIEIAEQLNQLNVTINHLNTTIGNQQRKG